MGEQVFNRRFVLAAGASVPLLLLPACASMGGGFNLVDAIRRLLTLSSQRAFAVLLQPGGFYDHSLARDVTDGANRGIWRAISAEESAIRANPGATNDPLLIAVFGLGGAGR
jgi:hypothetical protein